MTLRDPTNRNHKTLASSGPKTQSSAETKQVARALADLNAARKTILMYPKGHRQTQQSIDRACTA